MDNEASFVFLALIGAAVTAGIFAFFYLRACKSRTSFSSGEEERPETPPMDFEQTRHYLEALENVPKNNRMKFLSVVENYTGRENVREITREHLLRNIFFFILTLGNALLWLWLVFGGRETNVPGYVVPFTLSLVSGLIYWFRSTIFFRTVREAEIRHARNRLNNWYQKNKIPVPPVFPTRVTSSQPVQVHPVSLPPVYQYPTPPARTNASAKPASGGFSFKHLLLILALFGAFLAITDYFLVPGLIREFINNSSALGEVFEYKGGCPQEVRDNFVLPPARCDPDDGQGASRPGSQWCQVTLLKNGAEGHGWIPNECLK